METGLQVNINQMIGAFGGLCALFLGGLFGLLKYFFTKDASRIDSKFLEIQTELGDLREQLLNETRALDKRVQQVEIQIVRDYVPKISYENALGRVHDRLDEVLAALKGTK